MVSLAPYVRYNRKTQILEYRRVVPPNLQNCLPSIEGFSDRPRRTELVKSLSTRCRKEANAKAAQINAIVEAAFAKALSETSSVDKNTSQKQQDTKSLTKLINPEELVDALSQWGSAEKLSLVLKYANSADVTSPLLNVAETREGINELHEYAQNAFFSNRDLWRKVPDFDSLMLDALKCQGIFLQETHPVLSIIRPYFAIEWCAILRVQNKLKYSPNAVMNLLEEMQAEEVSIEKTATDNDNVAVTKGTRTSFLKYIDDWERTRRPKMEPRQLSNYKSILLDFSLSAKELCIETITKSQVKQWIVGVKERGLSDKTVRTKLSALNNYWRFLKYRNLAPDGIDPFDEVVERDNAMGKEKNMFHWEKSEVVKLWQEAQKTDPVLADLIRLAAFTGSRIEAMCKLTVSDVKTDPETNIRHLYFEKDKTTAGIRRVPIISCIEGLIDRRCANKRPNDYLFHENLTNRYGERSAAMSKRFGRFKKKHGFGKDKNFHSLRRTVATLLERANVRETVAADILGHRRPTMTYGVYAGSTTLQDRADALSKALNYGSEEFMAAA